MKNDYRKILIVKLCCIGDVIFITPTIKAIHLAFPDARIEILASKWIKDIVERIPFIDEVVFYNSPVHKEGLIYSAIETINIIKLLRKKKYDIAVFGHRSSIFPLITLLGGIKQRIGFKDTKFLTESVPFDDKAHEVDRYLSIIKLIQVYHAKKETILAAHKEDIAVAEKICQKLDLDRSKRYVGLFPGGGENPGTTMPIKRWNAERYAVLCQGLFEQVNLLPLFMGDTKDRKIVENILSILPKNIHAINTCGLTNLGGLCGLLKRCDIVIGGDTGPVHMAAALGVPTVMLFGPSDPRLVAPLGRIHRYVWEEVHCSPCYTPVSVLEKRNMRGNEFICWTGTHECMRKIQVKTVQNAVIDILKEIKTHKAK